MCSATDEQITVSNQIKCDGCYNFKLKSNDNALYETLKLSRAANSLKIRKLGLWYI